MDTKHDTKLQILDAAELLFAENGYHATSIRHITQQAEVNLAAIHYHFGSKENLLEAVLARRIQPVNELRLEQLRSLPEPQWTVRHLVESFLEPPFHAVVGMQDRSRQFVRMIGRVHSELSPQFHQVFKELMQETIMIFVQAFQKVLPNLPLPQIMMRLHFTIGTMAHAMHLISGQLPFAPEVPNPEMLILAIVDYCTAGFTYDLPNQTRG
ncbi:MAG: TetR/AcrR family transcriptional regulator [Acidobacteria bacterium]|nr:TetR/AcrR family transcriptional regulator [Acidobacteriota bacterium]